MKAERWMNAEKQFMEDDKLKEFIRNIRTVSLHLNSTLGKCHGLMDRHVVNLTLI